MLLVIEPQCRGFEHSQFNAALLAAVATVTDKIVFCAERKHLEFVRIALSSLDFSSKITYYEVLVAPRKISGTIRLAYEFRTFAMARKFAGGWTNRVLLTSSTTQSVYIAVFNRFFSFYKGETAILVHSILETAFQRPSLRPWEMPYWFMFALLLSRTPNLKLIVLGESIRQNVAQHFFGRYIRLGTIRLPCLFSLSVSPIKNLLKKRLSFGFIGKAEENKGFIDFIRLAEANKNSKVRFILAGFTNLVKTQKRAKEAWIEGIQEFPLSEADFRFRIDEMDYACFLYRPETYKFVASGAFFDAVDAEKPIIAIRNDYITWFFDHYGNIGYLCANLNEVFETITRLTITGKPKEYEIQRENLRQLKKDHSLVLIGIEFKNCLDTKSKIIGVKREADRLY